MYDEAFARQPGVTQPGCSAPAPCLEELRDILDRLAALDGAGVDEAVQLEQLAALERLKAAMAAAQARVTMALVHTRTRREAASGVAADRRCRGLAAEIALARRMSPHRGARELGLAKALVQEMPGTLAGLTRGEVSEWRATLVVRETAVLSREHRARVDEELAGRLPDLGDRAAAAEARRIGYRLDPGSALRRVRGANSDRHVSLRPAPDTMSYLSGFLPVAQGVACLASLRQHADSRRAQGDERSRGQIMADTLVERITGQATAGAVSVEVAVVMSEATLLGAAHAPAQITGYGPVPASLARQIVRDAARVWLRRLYTRPAEGSLVAMDSRRRAFEGELRRFLVIRDELCRTPWCDAPVRHVDHIIRVTDGGSTTVENGQGLCETCNYTKESPGWTSRRLDGDRHTVEIWTPTGHRYTSTAPDPPSPRPTQRPGAPTRGVPTTPTPRVVMARPERMLPQPVSPLEEALRRLVSA